MFNEQKIISYLGFAIKSRKIKFGVDDILKLKRADLILVSDELTSSGMNKIKNFSLKNKIDIIILKSDEFNKVIQNTSIKVTAILDKNLAEAIKMNLTNN